MNVDTNLLSKKPLDEFYNSYSNFYQLKTRNLKCNSCHHQLTHENDLL